MVIFDFDVFQMKKKTNNKTHVNNSQMEKKTWDFFPKTNQLAKLIYFVQNLVHDKIKITEYKE